MRVCVCDIKVECLTQININKAIIFLVHVYLGVCIKFVDKNTL